MSKMEILNIKIVEFSNVIEQNLEEILNELISNNYKLRNLRLDALFYDETSELYNEIKRFAMSASTLTNKKRGIKDKICGVFLKRDDNSENFTKAALILINFAYSLKNINSILTLIKYNINELYKYPKFKNQSYIPDFALMISSFFKKNIDMFFESGYGVDINNNNKLHEELRNIISLSRTILNEFSISDSNEGDDAGVNLIESPAVFYSNIVAYLELISITVFQLNNS